LVKKTRSLRRDWVNLTIGPGSTVATVEVVDDHKVSLRISREAEVGRITGITPEYF
jgi:hypothetical protein